MRPTGRLPPLPYDPSPPLPVMRTCRMLFMKHVLPRLLSPLNPRGRPSGDTTRLQEGGEGATCRGAAGQVSSAKGYVGRKEGRKEGRKVLNQALSRART